MQGPNVLSMKAQSSGTRERNGCLTCRQRKKKCDGAYPVCDQCRRLNFTCQRQDPRKPNSRPGRPRGRAGFSSTEKPEKIDACACALIPPAPKLSSFWIENGETQGAASRRIVMRYYIQSFTTLLTTTMENNCFLSVFLPMSMESPLLLHAITAWSSSHLALRNKSYEPIAISNRCLALQSLSKSLSSSARSPEMELASCLIHCAIESITGDTKEWFSHLVGAYEVIRSVSFNKESSQLDLGRFATSFEGRWLLRSFAYHDILMTVAEDRKPLIIAGEYWNFGNDTVVADSYFGLASRLMYLISKISILNVDMMNCTEGSAQAESFSHEAQALQQQLVSWTCGQSDNSMLVNLAETYRSAALIHLFRTIRQHRPQLTATLASRIAACAEEIVTKIKAMPANCLAESSLLLPLFLAGGEVEEPEKIAIIRQRMQDIVEARQFHNVQAVLTVLEEVWHLRATGVLGPGGRKVDWKDVLSRRKWMLSIT